jgi:hypothetical protein
MIGRFFRLCMVVLLILGGGASYCSVAVAQDSLEELQRRVDKLGPQQGGAGNPQLQKMLDKARAEAEAMNQSVDVKYSGQEPAVSEDDIPRTHVRGPDGVPFPQPEEVYLDPLPTNPFNNENKMAENLPLPQYTKPPRCDSNEPKREDRVVDDGHKEETILFEDLYLPEELVPVDIAEVYGAKVRLFPYGPRAGNGTYVRMRVDAVPCVPYRLRVTNRAWYYEQGNNALRNYDKVPSGRGEFSPWIQQKIMLGK